MIDHDVVLYGTDSAALTNCVVPFIASGLQDGGAAVVVASSEHERAFRSALAAVGINPESNSIRDRVVFLNAHESVKAVVNGFPDRERFGRLIGNPIRKLSERFRVHAYGEMVGILRSIGNSEAAAQLEGLWNELLAEVPFHLLCGYPVDVLGSEFTPGEMEVILTSHTKLISALPDLQPSLEAAMEFTLGTQRAAAIRGMISTTRRPGWATLGQPETTLLWLRQNLPAEADQIVERARNPFQA
jgi:hypothetical protein